MFLCFFISFFLSFFSHVFRCYWIWHHHANVDNLCLTSHGTCACICVSSCWDAADFCYYIYCCYFFCMIVGMLRAMCGRFRVFSFAPTINFSQYNNFCFFFSLSQMVCASICKFSCFFVSFFFFIAFLCFEWNKCWCFIVFHSLKRFDIKVQSVETPSTLLCVL